MCGPPNRAACVPGHDRPAEDVDARWVAEGGPARRVLANVEQQRSVLVVSVPGQFQAGRLKCVTGHRVQGL